MSQLHPDLLAVLVCPKCKGPFVLEETALRCDACRLRYRIDDGIPVLLIEEATPVEGEAPPAP